MNNVVLQTYEIAFEHVLDKIAQGEPLPRVLAEYHTQISPTLFRTWIYKDENRKKAWLVAKALSAEAIEDEMLRIADGFNADGTPSMTDTARATLQINTRKWLMQVNNRQKYGDTKYVETVTRSATSQLTTEQLEQQILESLGVI